MGNKQIQYDQLQYYTAIDYQNYGKCSIYTSNKFSQCFIIKIMHMMPNTHYENNFELYARIQNAQNLYLIGMYGYRVGKNCHCPDFKSHNLNQRMIEDSESQESFIDIPKKCKSYVVSNFVTIYWEYLAFSLKDLILQRKKIGLSFHETEMWHLIKACTFGYPAFARNCVSFQFKPSNLMINQDGRIRLNWMHIQYKNTHRTVYKKLSRRLSDDFSDSSSFSSEKPITLLSQEYLAPEELTLLIQKQLTSKMNYEKTNIFALGMTILECITLLDPIDHFYERNKLFINFQKVQYVLRSQSICERYTFQLRQLVKNMVSWDYMRRPSFENIQSRYNFFMKPDYSIKVTKDFGQTKLTLKPQMKEEHRKISIAHLKKSELFPNYQARDIRRI